MKTIVVIPAFNEEETISDVVSSLQIYVDQVIVVDDGSTDKTSIRAEQAGALILRRSVNVGYSNALNVGFKKAAEVGAGIIVTFDADGQHNAEDIPRLVNPIVQGKADVVVAQRARQASVGELLFSLYTRFRWGIKDPLCGLKAYHISVYTEIGHFDRLQSIGTELMIRVLDKGCRIIKVSIDVKDRKGTSRFYAHILRANFKIVKALIRVIWEIEFVRNT